MLLSGYFRQESGELGAHHYVPRYRYAKLCRSGRSLFKIAYLEVTLNPVGQVAANPNKNIS